VALSAFVMSEETSLRSMGPYYAVIAVCAIQAWRPTLLLWCLLMTAFLAMLVTIVSAGAATTTDRLVFGVLLGVPIIALWYFRPAPDADGGLHSKGER